MVSLNDLGIEIIKCENREGSDNIKTLHYSINDIIFRYAKQPVSKCLAYDISERLKEIGIKLSEVETTSKQEAKKKEILSFIKRYYIILKKYINNYDGSDDTSSIQRILNYAVNQYLRKKKEGTLTEDEILTLLKKNKEIDKFYIQCTDATGLKTKPFYTMQLELISMFDNEYRLENPNFAVH